MGSINLWCQNIYFNVSRKKTDVFRGHYNKRSENFKNNSKNFFCIEMPARRCMHPKSFIRFMGFKPHPCWLLNRNGTAFHEVTKYRESSN